MEIIVLLVVGMLLVVYAVLAARNSIPKDYAEAVKWFYRAAERGHVNVQYKLGYMYYFGKGAPKNYVEAAKWLRKAAEQGHVKAQYNLGYM